MNFKIFFFLTFISLASLYSQTNYELPDVVVTAGRSEISFSELTRNVVIISGDEIRNSPASSLPDILQYAGVDVRQRGVEGVQSDVSIRGGTFEQTLVMVDGIKINDPQTGHHNMNLPVSPDNIERIEILKGQGSRSFGANAFSGVINFITKKGPRKKIFLQAEGGENGYYSGAFNGSYSLGELSNHISLSKKKSDGYRHNTNFDMINFSYNSSLKLDDNRINFLFGYNEKEFGANGFYSDRFPNQWERTITKLAGIGGKFGNEGFSLEPKVSWRRNNDRFLLNYENPSFYENNHLTDIYGAELQASVNTGFGLTTVGGEFTQDKIESNNLGYHNRNTKGIFAEQRFSPVKDLLIVAGAFAYDYPTAGWKFWPGLDFSYHFNPLIRLFGSAGKAFRIPTYTDLYYSDAASQGNSNLLYEETLNFELGVNYSVPGIIVNLNFFRKEGKNIIDWFRRTETEKWIARNISSINTNGIEFNLKFNPKIIKNNFPITAVEIDYTRLDLTKELDESASRYALDHLKDQLVISIRHPLSLNISQSWMLRYENRINLGSSFLVDTRLNFNLNDFRFYLKATNLFNKSYTDFTGLPLPGRWIIAGTDLIINI